MLELSLIKEQVTYDVEGTFNDEHLLRTRHCGLYWEPEKCGISLVASKVLQLSVET